jgi:hypothetical protein
MEGEERKYDLVNLFLYKAAASSLVMQSELHFTCNQGQSKILLPSM